jgi:hypothetical protein
VEPRQEPAFQLLLGDMLRNKRHSKNVLDPQAIGRYCRPLKSISHPPKTYTCFLICIFTLLFCTRVAPQSEICSLKRATSTAHLKLVYLTTQQDNTEWSSQEVSYGQCT